MGCFSSKEKRLMLEDDSEKRRPLSPATCRHELMISGLEGNKFLPLVRSRKTKKTSNGRRRRILRTKDVLPVAAILRTLNGVKGGGVICSVDKSPASIIRSPKQCADFSFFNPRFGIQHVIPRPNESLAATAKIQENIHLEDAGISFPTKELKCVKVISSPSEELLGGQQVSIYSPSTYVTPRFGSYGIPTQ